MLIRLLNGCHDPGCQALTERTRSLLDVPHYSRGVSVLSLPASLEAWRTARRTARKRADRARRLGYRFAVIDRSQHNTAIHEINTSKPERQGRPMSASYLAPAAYTPLPEYPCAHHAICTYGVLDQDDVLRAYIVVHRVGELALVSQILGHAAHEPNDVMYLLVQGTLEQQAPLGGIAYYNRWDSGTDGLRYFKERLGFQIADVEWAA